MSRRFAFTLTLILAAGAQPAAAQPATGPMYESYRRAYDVIARALQAHGGAAVRELRGIDYRYRGVTYDRDQGLHASTAFDPHPPRRPVTVRAAVDFAGSRQLTEFGSDATGQEPVAMRTVQRGRELLRYAPPGSGAARTFTRDSLPAGAPAAFPFPHQLMPVLVLRQAVARGTTLRHMGRRRSPAGAEDVVSFSNADGSVLAVGIDTATARLTTVETIGEIGLFGDGDHVWRFGGYERSRGILVPRGFQHRINGLLQEDMQLVHVAIDPAWGDTSFGPPAGYALRPRDPGASRPPGVVDSGGGVYFVEGVGGSRTMFVDIGDGIVAVEAPQSTRVAEQTIALIEQTRPGKPITHLVLTHHHLDHVGGVRAFVERGATVIVPHGMDDYLRRIIGGTRTFGTLGEAPRPAAVPTIESVADRRRIGSVEVVHATTAHAAHTLVVYVPSRRLLFQGDRLRVDGAAESPRVMQAAADLASVIERYALDVRTIGFVHGANATIDDLRTVLRSRAASRR